MSEQYVWIFDLFEYLVSLPVNDEFSVQYRSRRPNQSRGIAGTVTSVGECVSISCRFTTGSPFHYAYFDGKLTLDTAKKVVTLHTEDFSTVDLGELIDSIFKVYNNAKPWQLTLESTSMYDDMPDLEPED